VSNHTPGPWTQHAVDLNDGIDGNYRAIVSGRGLFNSREGFELNGFIREPDAKLIAAAPDLLEALQQCLQYIEYDEFSHDRKFAAGNVARTAIKKATEATE